MRDASHSSKNDFKIVGSNAEQARRKCDWSYIVREPFLASVSLLSSWAHLCAQTLPFLKHYE